MAFGDRFRRNFREQAGNTDFTDRVREDVEQPATLTSGRDTNKVKRSKARSVKAALPGEMDNVTRDDIGGLNSRARPSQADIDRREFAEARAPSEGRGPAIFGPNAVAANDTSNEPERPTTRAPGSGFDVENSQVIASASPDSALSSGVRNLRQRGGTVNTIPAESFVNPAFTGINSGKNIARRVRKNFARDQREAEIEGDREFRRNLRERQLLDDANLQLSGDMSLTELADAASRRRNARRTLQNRETLSSDQAIARSEAQQEASLEMLKERGRNARAGLKARTELTADERAAQREAAEQGRERVRQSIEGIFTNQEGDVNQALAEDTIGFIDASNQDVATLGEAGAIKMAQFNKLRHNLMDNSSVAPENLAELEKSIGNIDKEVLNEFGSWLQGLGPTLGTLGGSQIMGRLFQMLDSTDVRIRNKDGRAVGQVNLERLAPEGDGPAQRALLELITANLPEDQRDLISTFLTPTPPSE